MEIVEFPNRTFHPKNLHFFPAFQPFQGTKDQGEYGKIMTFWWPVHRTRKQIISDNFNSMEQFYKLFAHQFDKKNSRVALSLLLTFYFLQFQTD